MGFVISQHFSAAQLQSLGLQPLLYNRWWNWVKEAQELTSLTSTIWGDNQPTNNNKESKDSSEKVPLR
jgi:hypothetical protein